MERTKLKLGVILLLAALNLGLLAVVFGQHWQSRQYEDTAREQALVYLDRAGIHADPAVVPWKSGLEATPEKAAAQVLDPSTLPEEGPSRTCEVQTRRRPETLLVEFVGNLGDRTDTTIVQITEGYRYTSEGARAVLTPVWEIVTDRSVFLLDCTSGNILREESLP